MYNDTRMYAHSLMVRGASSVSMGCGWDADVHVSVCSGGRPGTRRPDQWGTNTSPLPFSPFPQEMPRMHLL